jgi:tRNA pseudouridine13 synthase
MEGEVWMLDGSHSVFGPVPFDDALAERVRRGDIHPTGPLWGAGTLRSAAAAGLLEEQALQPFDAIRSGLDAAGLRQERRALRVRPADVELEWLDTVTLRLGFFLPAGAYATSLLYALGEIEDAAASR